MKAIWAEPLVPETWPFGSSVEVAQRWISAIWLPSVDSPPRFSVPSDSRARSNGPPSLPSVCAPTTAAAATASDTIEATAGSFGALNSVLTGPFTPTRFDVTSTGLPAVSKEYTSWSRATPYEPAWRTGREVIARPDHPGTGKEQLYSRCVWPESTASTLSLMPFSSSANDDPLVSIVEQSVDAAPSW